MTAKRDDTRNSISIFFFTEIGRDKDVAMKLDIEHSLKPVAKNTDVYPYI